MKEAERFGELRSAAHTLVGEARWARLVELLEDWPADPLEQVALPYLRDLLREDTSERQAPRAWWRLGPGGSVHPAWPLVNMLCIDRTHALLTDAHLASIQTLELRDISPSRHRWRQTKNLHTLRFFGCFFFEGLAESLWSDEPPSQLRALELRRNHWEIQEDIWKLLASARLSEQLIELRIESEDLTAQGDQRLRLPQLHTLRSLTLRDACLIDEDVYALTRSGWIGGLTTLNLRSNKLSPEAVQALASAAALSKLRSLDLSDHHFADYGSNGAQRALDALLHSTHLQRLTSLSWDHNHMDEEDLYRLIRAPTLQGLDTLTLRGNHISLEPRETLEPLRGGVLLPKLTWLDLSQNDLGDWGAAMLADPEADLLAGLARLDLSENSLGPEGAKALAQSPHLARLTWLDLSHNRLGDEGAQALARSPHLRQLHTLALSRNDIGPEGARALASSPHLRQELREPWRKLAALEQGLDYPTHEDEG